MQAANIPFSLHLSNWSQASTFISPEGTQANSPSGEDDLNLTDIFFSPFCYLIIEDICQISKPLRGLWRRKRLKHGSVKSAAYLF